MDEAQKQAANLDKFYQELQQNSRDFLTATHQQRMTQAKEQNQQLRQFRRDLFISIFGIPTTSAKQVKTSPKQPKN